MPRGMHISLCLSAQGGLFKAHSCIPCCSGQVRHMSTVRDSHVPWQIQCCAYVIKRNTVAHNSGPVDVFVTVVPCLTHVAVSQRCSAVLGQLLLLGHREAGFFGQVAVLHTVTTRLQTGSPYSDSTYLVSLPGEREKGEEGQEGSLHSQRHTQAPLCLSTLQWVRCFPKERPLSGPSGMPSGGPRHVWACPVSNAHIHKNKVHLTSLILFTLLQH